MIQTRDLQIIRPALNRRATIGAHVCFELIKYPSLAFRWFKLSCMDWAKVFSFHHSFFSKSADTDKIREKGSQEKEGTETQNASGMRPTKQQAQSRF